MRAILADRERDIDAGRDHIASPLGKEEKGMGDSRHASIKGSFALCTK